MRLVLCLLVLLCLAPREARAWANAQVTSAHAEADVSAEGGVRARFELQVRVLGGWLSELEIAGLDHDLVLDETTPPTFARATGEAIPFELISDASGRVSFRFRQGNAPRVGDYVASFGYGASIAQGGIRAAEEDAGRVAYAWTFPAWDTGLDAVEVVLRAPAGAAVQAGDEDALTGVTLQTSEEAGRPRFAMRRLHLPRSIPWTVSFTLPRDQVPAELRPPSTPRAVRAVVATSRDGRPQPSTRLVCAAFVLVALVKRVTFGRRARARGSVPRPWVPFASDVVVAPLIVALGAGAAFAWPRSPETAFVALVAVVALVVQRPARRVATARIGSFRVASEADVRSARWACFVDSVSLASLFDATRWAGMLVGLATLAGLWFLHMKEPADSADAVFSVHHALVLLGLLFLVGGASMVPRSVEERLLALEAVARSLRLPSDAGRRFGFRLALHRDAHDVAQDARLRLSSEHRAPGLVRIDIALVERATLGGYVLATVLLAVVRQGSPAERILMRALPSQGVKVAPGGRRARVLPLRPSTWAVLDKLAVEGEAEPTTVRRASLARDPDAPSAPALL